MANPRAVLITVPETDRAVLQGWLRRRCTSQALALRARIILACAEPGVSNLAIAESLHISNLTVGKWRRRYAEHGLAGLADLPRCGAPRSIGDEQVERIIATTLQTRPPAATHWSSRQLAQQTHMSQSSICRIWRAFGLAPHRTASFKLSTDAHFIDKVRDIVGLYIAPPDRALVLCIDEKPSIQANTDTAPPIDMAVGQPERHTHDYVRHGTTDLFAALDTATGIVIGEVHRRHRSIDFRHFLGTVDKATPPDLELHLVQGNASTHKTPMIHRWLLRHPRVHLHFTPTSSSWLNLVECWFSILQRRRLARGQFSSVQSLEQAIRQYIAQHNSNPKPFIWTKSAEDILDAVKHFCLRTSDSYH